MKLQTIILILCFFTLISSVFAQNKELFLFGATFSDYTNIKGSIPKIGFTASLYRTNHQANNWVIRYGIQVDRNITLMEKQLRRSITDINDEEQFHFGDMTSNFTTVEPTLLFGKDFCKNNLRVQPYGGISYVIFIKDDTSFESKSVLEYPQDVNDNNIVYNTYRDTGWLTKVLINSGFGINIGFVINFQNLLIDLKYFRSLFDIELLGNAEINKKYHSLSLSVGTSL